MEDLLFSINATFPVFLLIVLGFIMQKLDIVGIDFSNSVNKYVFRIGFPFLLFHDISQILITESFDKNYILFCALITTISFVAIWGASHVFIKNPKIRGSFVQGACRGSAASLGLAFITNMYGSTGMASLMIIAAVPLYNIYSVIILTMEADTGSNETKKINYKKIGRSIITNPIIIGIVLGILSSLLRIKLPHVLNKTVSSIATTAAPMALLAIGSSLKLEEMIHKLQPAIISSFIKLAVLPLIFVPVGILLGFRNETLVSILIMLGSPATSNCFIMAKNMNNDEVLAGSIVGITTLLSAVTLTLGIYLLKLYGYI